MDAPITESRATRDTVSVRPLRPGDADALERFYAALTPESRWLRFFSASRGLSHQQSTWFCRATRDDHRGLVAVAQDGCGPERIVGHLCLEPDRPAMPAGGRQAATADRLAADAAEVAVVVADEFQGRGIGHQLMRNGMTWARSQGFHRLTASTFVANEPIRRLLGDFGLTVRPAPPAAGVCSLAVDLTEPPRAPI